MNWGYKIMLTYGLFVAGIGFLVYRSVTQKVDLVTADYYAEELKFQDKIDEHKNAAVLSSEIKVDFKDNVLTLTFPEEFKGKQLKGDLLLYYPADENKDIKFDFTTTDAIVKKELPKGIYGQHEVHINWSLDAVNYYFEKKIFL